MNINRAPETEWLKMNASNIGINIDVYVKAMI